MIDQTSNELTGHRVKIIRAFFDGSGKFLSSHTIVGMVESHKAGSTAIMMSPDNANRTALFIGDTKYQTNRIEILQ